MHINVTLRGYEEERERIKRFKDRIQDFIEGWTDEEEQDLVDAGEVDYEWLDENDIVESNIHTHTYPTEQGEKFYVG
jgi:hypothetical protein